MRLAIVQDNVGRWQKGHKIVGQGPPVHPRKTGLPGYARRVPSALPGTRDAVFWGRAATVPSTSGAVCGEVSRRRGSEHDDLGPFEVGVDPRRPRTHAGARPDLEGDQRQRGHDPAAAIAFYAMLASVPFLAILITLAVQLLPEDALVARDVNQQAVSQFQSTMDRLLPDQAADVVRRPDQADRKNPPFGLLSFGLLVRLDRVEPLRGDYRWPQRDVRGGREPFLREAPAHGDRDDLDSGRDPDRGLGGDRRRTGIPRLGRPGRHDLQDPDPRRPVGRSHLDDPDKLRLDLLCCADVEQRWVWITPGSFYGTAAVLGFTLLFRVYVRNWGNYQETYGSLAGVMVLLLWLWVSSLVLLAAAKLNQVVEEASPVGKSKGQKSDPTSPPDFAAMEPRPMSQERE